MTKLQKILCGWAVAVSLVAISPGAVAAVTCTVSANPVIFSTYNVWDPSPNNTGKGSVTINCNAGGNGNGNGNGNSNSGSSVMLSTGQSNSYALRTMKSGANTLNYNLYTTAAYDVVWGDGTGGSSSMPTKKNADITLTVFGQIPAGQDAAVGDYTDSVTVFVEF